ncbi:MAG TPA: COX15/CtaA family protein [Nitrospirota bacterium]|nr:COX15/CtaA family protein [Nitrospirota bacterium]
MLGRTTVVLFFLLLVWGNLVAGMKAGLGCPDWPLCHGRVLPPLRLDVYMEFMHRVIAAAATGFLAVLAFRRLKAYRGVAKAVPVTAAGLVAAEVVIGGFVVLFELPVQLTTVHFMVGLVVFSLVLYMAWFDGAVRPPRLSSGGVPMLFLVMAAAVFFQAALGAYVRHSGSGLACPDFPACLGGFLPPVMDTRVLAHLSHRLLAYMILLTAAALYLSTALSGRLRGSQGGALLLLFLVAGQIVVGAIVVLSKLYFMAAAAHLAVALAMLVVLGWMWAREVSRPEGATSWTHRP